MELAAIAAVHGGKAVRNAGLAHFFGGGFGGKAEFFGTQRLEVGGVKADHVVLVVIEAEHLHGEGFKRTQQLAVVLDNQRYIGAGELDVDLARLDAMGIARAIARRDAVLEAEPAKFVQGIQESGNFLCGQLEVFNRHNRQVSQSGAGIC